MSECGICRNTLNQFESVVCIKCVTDAQLGREDPAALRAERDALRDRIAALTREPDEAEVEQVAKATAGDWDALAYYMQESYRMIARRAIAAFLDGRRDAGKERA